MHTCWWVKMCVFQSAVPLDQTLHSLDGVDFNKVVKKCPFIRCTTYGIPHRYRQYSNEPLRTGVVQWPPLCIMLYCPFKRCAVEPIKRKGRASHRIKSFIGNKSQKNNALTYKTSITISICVRPVPPTSIQVDHSSYKERLLTTD